jgi:hypothetical protein
MFAMPPDPLSGRGKALVASLMAGVALSRLFAVAQSLWDWDEALFALGVRDYDVTVHHPHPPGFPLFVLLGKLVARISDLDEFRALQLIAVGASMLLFPAMWFLMRELRAPQFVAISAALVLSFLPNVWFYGGTGLSDVPSLVLSLIASALLLRGCRSGTSLIAGALLLGVAAGVRPQNLIIGFVPALIALRCRWKTALAGGMLGSIVILAAYGWAAVESGGWNAYREAVSRHADYIRMTDSFLAPLHPGLIQVADDFFLRPFRAPIINGVWALLAAAALVTRRRHALLMLAIFGPFVLFAWLSLDFHSSSRFSIAYMPLFAVLAVEGIDVLWQRVRYRVVARAATLVAFLVLMIGWTWPALRVARSTVSPPVAAIDTVRSAGSDTVIYVDERLGAHAALLLPERELRLAGSVPPLLFGHSGLLLREGPSVAPGSWSFARERRRLDGIARSRYFEASVVPARRLEVEQVGGLSRAMFSGIRNAELTMEVRAGAPCTIEVWLDQRMLERFAVPATTTAKRAWRVRSPRELVIESYCDGTRAELERLAMIPIQ